MLLFGVVAYATAGKNDIFGSWECVVITDEAEDFLYSLYFAEPDNVTLTVGWYQSEIAGTYTGRFTMEDRDVIRLEMAGLESSGALNETYSFDVTDGLLILSKQSGDSLSFLYETGVPMAFLSVPGYELASGMLVEQATNLLYDNVLDAHLLYPGELDRQVGSALFYGFVCAQGDIYRYAWVNAMTGGIEWADEIEDYTGEGVSANTAGVNDGELIDYLLASVPEAYQWVMLMDRGLTALVTGKTTTLSNGLCRDIQLGMGEGTAFAPFITYTVSPFGSVYEYNPENNSWTAVYMKPAD